MHIIKRKGYEVKPPKIGKLRSTERRDVVMLKLKNAIAVPRPGEYFRESPGEWTIHDKFGKVRQYPKLRYGQPQVLEVVVAPPPQ